MAHIFLESVIPISSFRDVEITRNKPLVLCDIDNTIIGYDKPFSFFLDKIKQETPDNSISDLQIQINANQLYNYYNRLNPPIHCDYVGFMDLLERVNNLGGELQFLTARGKSSWRYTRDQFSQIGLVYEDYRVHYTDCRITKGEYIRRYFNTSFFGEVVFIDDLDSYINSVVDLCPEIQCYRFEYKPKCKNANMRNDG